MKAIIIVFITFVSFGSFAQKKYNRSIIFSGMSINWAPLLGTFDVFNEQGKEIDVVIGVCGGSIAAAYVTSDEYINGGVDSISEISHRVNQQTKIGNSTTLPILPFYLNAEKWYHAKRIPPLKKSQKIFDIPQNWSEKFTQKKFDELNGPKLIIFAMKALYDPYENKYEYEVPAYHSYGYPDYRYPKFRPAKRNGKKLFKQVIFTDSETAKLIEGYLPIHIELRPDSAMAHEIEIITDATIGDAVRASISDPLLVNPKFMDGDYYFTGAADNYPYTLAEKVSHNVIDHFSRPLNVGELMFITAYTGFATTDNLDYVIENHLDDYEYFVDLTEGMDELIDKYGFDPKFKFSLITRNRHLIPFKKYEENLLKQYKFGRNKAQEALLDNNLKEGIKAKWESYAPLLIKE